MDYWDGGDEGPRWLTVLAGAVVGALVVGMIWFVQARASDGPSDDPPADAKEAVGRAQTNPERSPDRLTRCHEVYEAQTEPLRAAVPSLTAWEIHIGAMNQLVTGAITLEQATQFWDETRLTAADLLARHESAAEEYAQRTARCPRTYPETASKAEARCTKAVAARGKELYNGSISVATFRRHVHHMEMLRNGEMSPEEATQAWLMSWHKGARELRDYRAAAAEAKGQTC